MDLRKVPSDLRDLFRRMNTTQRVSVAAALLALVACLALLVVWGSSDNLTPLLVDAPPDVLYQVVKKLEEKGVRFEIKQNLVLVPADRKERLVLELAGEGAFPEGVDLFKWVYEQDLTDTGGKRDLKYQRSLVRRLETVIGSLEAVAAVKVEIVRPPETPFLSDGREAKASVLLKLRPGRALGKDNILGIAKLVAGSVDGLLPANVNLVDTAGRYYRVPGEKDLGSVPTDQLETKRAFERQEEAKLVDHLGFLQHKIVTVDVTLDFQSLRKQIHDVDPTRTVETLEKERSVRGMRPGVAAAAAAAPAPAPASAAGAAPAPAPTELGIATGPFGGPEPAAPAPAPAPAATPAGAVPAPAAPGAGPQELESEVRREAARSETTLEIPPGSIKDLSVAVLVDKDELAQRDMTVEALRDQLAGATRVSDPAKLKVSAISFATPPALPEPTPGERFEVLVQRYATPLLLGALLLASAFTLYRSVRRAVPGDVLDEIARLRRQLVAEAGEPVAPGESKRIEEIRRLVSDNPRIAASLIGRWIEQTE